MLSNQANKRIIIQHIYSIIVKKPWTNWKKGSTQLRKKIFLTGKYFFHSEVASIDEYSYRKIQTAFFGFPA